MCGFQSLKYLLSGSFLGKKLLISGLSHSLLNLSVPQNYLKDLLKQIALSTQISDSVGLDKAYKFAFPILSNDPQTTLHRQLPILCSL